jgi:hypothetical protein
MNMTPKRKAGRPAYEPTPKERGQVKMLAAFGTREDDICKLMGFSTTVLRKYFSQEMDLGHIEANAQVAQTLFKMATDKDRPNVAAVIFWLKTRAQWRDVSPPIKEAREIEAENADKGTSWAGLLAEPTIIGQPSRLQ